MKMKKIKNRMIIIHLALLTLVTYTFGIWSLGFIVDTYTNEELINIIYGLYFISPFIAWIGYLKVIPVLLLIPVFIPSYSIFATFFSLMGTGFGLFALFIVLPLLLLIWCCIYSYLLLKNRD